MKYAALAAAVAASALPEASAFSAAGALPLRSSQLPTVSCVAPARTWPAPVAPAAVRLCGRTRALAWARASLINDVAVQAHCVHRPTAVVTMSAQPKGFLGKIKKAATGAAFAAVLGMGAVAPRKALADSEFAVDASGMVMEPELIQPPAQPSAGFDIVRAGVAGGAGAATFGGMLAVAIKKQKSELETHAEQFEEELKRLENFKQEFLDGVPSDNSLMASLNKAMNPKKVEKEEEDEFEKNVRLFLEEEQAKEDKKNGKDTPPANAKQGGATLLERPSDPSGDKAEEWMNDVVFEDKPAEIDDEQLKALQRMFGTGDDKK